MRYYSTNHISPDVTVGEAVVKGLAPDNGLYMPERINPLADDEITRLPEMDFREIGRTVARRLFDGDIPGDALDEIVDGTLTFDTPVREVMTGVWSLELFHGPTLAFKDVGARFMARMLRHFLKDDPRTIHVLVATSGDTGSAVANGFLGLEGIKVHVLYPKGKVSPIQECQFTTLGQNVTAIEVDGTFDDCQRLVKTAFLDSGLNSRMLLTSANSINIARLFPQTFYYFNAWAQLRRAGVGGEVVFSVPSGNFGNLTAGLIARKMGLRDIRFIAANNANDIFLEYLRTGAYNPRPSIQTIANAMDVGDPSNFRRILDLFGGNHEAICNIISGAAYTDDEIAATMRECYGTAGYVADPHGACALRALVQGKRPGETGVFLETAHPAKFKDTVDGILGTGIEIPRRLRAFMEGTKSSLPMSARYDAFEAYLKGIAEQ